MKKFFALMLLAVTCCAASLSLLVGCSDEEHATDSPDSLQFNVKYCYYKSIHDNENDEFAYYIFYSNGTCMRYSQSGHTSYLDGYVKEYDWKTYYKYTYIDEQKTGVMCFFDSIKYTYYNDDGSIDHVMTERDMSTDLMYKEYRVLSVSKNVLMSSGTYSNSYYINENYIKEIPNFYPKGDN
ncbi:MAG: hypothetical protein K2O39_05910 [Clostridiales bacterium]|nr:hypothetical protein [Clostridiales bacterium]